MPSWTNAPASLAWSKESVGCQGYLAKPTPRLTPLASRSIRVEMTCPKGFSMFSSSCSSIETGRFEMYKLVGSCSCCCEENTHSRNKCQSSCSHTYSDSNDLHKLCLQKNNHLDGTWPSEWYRNWPGVRKTQVQVRTLFTKSLTKLSEITTVQGVFWSDLPCCFCDWRHEKPRMERRLKEWVVKAESCVNEDYEMLEGLMGTSLPVSHSRTGGIHCCVDGLF